MVHVSHRIEPHSDESLLHCRGRVRDLTRLRPPVIRGWEWEPERQQGGGEDYGEDGEVTKPENFLSIGFTLRAKVLARETTPVKTRVDRDGRAPGMSCLTSTQRNPCPRVLLYSPPPANLHP